MTMSNTKNVIRTAFVAAVVVASGALAFVLTADQQPDCRPIAEVEAEVEVGRSMVGYTDDRYDPIAERGLAAYANGCR